MPSTHTEHDSSRVQKASLLKHTIRRTTWQKSFDRTKRAVSFSHCKNGNISIVDEAGTNVLADEDGNIMLLSDVDSVAFVGKFQSSILIPNQM